MGHRILNGHVNSNKKNMKNTGNILLGILGAAAAGVVIGMIVAPKKGTALRSDIRHTADDFTRKLGKMLSKGMSRYNEIRSMVDEEGANLKRSAKDLANEAERTYRDYSNKAEDVYDELANGATKAYKKAKS